MDLFSGTVANYRRYRSGVPAEVVGLLVAQTRAPAGRRRLLDLGTGTGFVIEALKNDFAEIVGVDPAADMLAAARADVVPLPGQQISWDRSTTEDFRPAAGSEPDLVTVARAFHWFDQDAVLAALDTYTAPQGTVAVMGDQSVWTSPQEWKAALRALVQSFLGEARRAGNGVKRDDGRPFREILQQSAFGAVEEHAVRTSRQRDTASVIGYLHSTSFAAPRLFGDRLAEFDTQATRLLDTYAADGLLSDENEFSVLIARRELPPPCALDPESDGPPGLRGKQHVSFWVDGRSRDSAKGHVLHRTPATAEPSCMQLRIGDPVAQFLGALSRTVTAASCD